jgi:hypothetical protein
MFIRYIKKKVAEGRKGGAKGKVDGKEERTNVFIKDGNLAESGCEDRY